MPESCTICKMGPSQKISRLGPVHGGIAAASASNSAHVSTLITWAIITKTLRFGPAGRRGVSGQDNVVVVVVKMRRVVSVMEVGRRRG